MHGTKLTVQLFGPMQTQNQPNAITVEGCQLKVNIEFNDENHKVLLQQMPLVQESIEAVKEAMPTEAVAQMQAERKLKAETSLLSQQMAQVLAASICTSEYNGS